ncbi:hypothetical protein SDC9_132926 [bioreactor metagenome]|uniref:Uncharacterized protein n=1 Tax=bioreactor metagenome TaxID=1076179 RepID=A0A645DA88_9ZZZZ
MTAKEFSVAMRADQSGFSLYKNMVGGQYLLMDDSGILEESESLAAIETLIDGEDD